MRTAADLGVPDTFNCASWLVDRHVEEGRGSAVAIECGDQRVTYADLAERVARFGSALQSVVGIRPGDRIALLLLDGPAFVVCFLGAIRIGAVPIPTNTLWKADDYRFLINDSGARLLVIAEELLPELSQIPRSALPGLHHVLVVERDDSPAPGDFARLLAEGHAGAGPAMVSRDQPAFWLYSSGSTGSPKGCVHLHHDMAVCAMLFGRGVLGITAEDRCFSVPKLFFAYGLGNALTFPLSVGATTILWPGAPAAAHVYATIERHRPSLFFSVPTGYGMLLATGGQFDLSSIRLAVSAGEALPPALYERFKARFGIDIIDGIGSTEALHMFISNRPGVIRPGSSGQVVPGYDARVLNDEGGELAGEAIGNLWIRGDSVCDGYWNQADRTAATIVDGWLRTGDKYSVDADGFYWYAGRADDMLKVGGLWVSPVEVENALVEHSAVLECAVAAREDHDRLVKPAAFVVLRDGVEASTALADELQAFVRERIAPYKRPRWVYFIAELPKTPTGKVQRYKLRQSSGPREGEERP